MSNGRAALLTHRKHARWSQLEYYRRASQTTQRQNTVDGCNTRTGQLWILASAGYSRLHTGDEAETPAS